ncbi:hypothetical protein BOVATA_026280 [Babesia ovata]|uniref:Uncharacterized protein n=1 Tax=Babesia ovata TaxID=189622 RepID=A0A2H6KDR9_9APIC|nr:uncharacterized protein BOVATA_026280 [Babesia ovata]GBE61135.1 hypothetical protein BOVATA_026280 [Babesia ovata]
MCLSTALDVINLVVNTVTDPPAHFRDDIADNSASEFTGLVHRVSVKNTVQQGTGKEVTGTRGVNDGDTGGRNLESPTAENNEGAIRTHSDDHSLVLELLNRGKVLEVLENFLRGVKVVKPHVLLKVTTQVSRFLSNRLQELTVLPDAHSVSEQGNDLLATAKSGVDHLVGKINVARGTQHEAVNYVEVEFVHDALIQIVSSKGLRGTRYVVLAVLAIRGNQGVEVAGVHVRPADGLHFNTVVGKVVVEFVSQIILTEHSEVGSLATAVSVRARSVG